MLKKIKIKNSFENFYVEFFKILKLNNIFTKDFYDIFMSATL